MAQPRTAYFGTEWANFFKPQFIIDKGTVLFDTIAWGRDSWPEINPSIQYYNLEDHSGATIFRNCMVIADGAGTIFYDMRKKAPISVDGISRFKYVPKRYAADVEDEDFAMVKMTSNTIALIDMKNNQPLRLPNGEYWFNNLIDARNYNYGRNTDCCFLDKTKAPFLEIIYDMSSGEKYFFNVATRKFVTAPSMEEALGLTSTGYTPCISHNEQLGNDFAILTYEQVNRRGWGESAGEIIVDGNFNKAYIGNFNKFYGLQIKDEVIAFRPFKDQAPSPEQIFLPKPGVADLNRDLVYDTQSDMILKVDGKYLLTGGIKGYGSVCYVLDDYGYKALFVNVPGTNGPGSVKSYCLIYDANRKALLMNPYKYPSSLLFEYHEYSSGFDKEEYETLTKHPWSYSKKNHRCLVVFKDGGFNPNDYHQDYDWNHDYFIDANLRKHLVVLDPETLAPYPLDLENREGLHSSIGVQQEPSPAIQIREEDIKKMVKNAINEIYGKRK